MQVPQDLLLVQFACRFGNFGALVLPVVLLVVLLVVLRGWQNIQLSGGAETTELDSLDWQFSHRCQQQWFIMQISNLDLQVSDVIGLKSFCKTCSMYCSSSMLRRPILCLLYYGNWRCSTDHAFWRRDWSRLRCQKNPLHILGRATPTQYVRIGSSDKRVYWTPSTY